MDNKRLLKVLNSMEIFDWSCAGEECEYVLVEDNKENRNMLLKAGLTKEDIDEYVNEETIDISMIAWEKTDAGYWSYMSGFSIITA